MSLLRKVTNWLNKPLVITVTKTTTTEGENTMGAIPSKNEAIITKRKNGTFRLRAEDGTVFGDYKRRRDAVRGATRRGLTVA